MNRKKLLFIVEDLYRAGAQRFAYEIDSALDKEKYQITILCLEKKNNINTLWGHRYYEDKHIKLGSNIVFIDTFIRKNTFFNKALQKIKKRLSNKKYSKFKKNLDSFFSTFDLIHWMGEYTVIHNLDRSVYEKSLIQSMSAKFQNLEIYKNFDFEFNYNFASGFSIQESLYEFSEFKKIKYYYFPLLLIIPFQKNNWHYKNTEILKIGIFTRLSHYKPLDVFFYSFHLLLDKLPNCELHIYGNGDPVKTKMDRYLRTLNIKDKVFFRGHQDNIVETAITEHINLSWFQGYNNDRPAGYAGFDICSTGTPLICWDFAENQTNPFNKTYPHYKNISKFVEKSIEILTHSHAAKELSELQFKDIIQNRDIAKNINSLEYIYHEILSEKK